MKIDLLNKEINGMSLARAIAIDLLEANPDTDWLEGDAWYDAEDSKTEEVEEILNLVERYLNED